jgi:diaminopimelate epimerase
VVGATVDMGPVTYDPEAIPLDASSAFDLTAEFHGVEYQGDAAGMGNPHLVLLVADPATARVTQHGPRLEHDARFPKGTNVEFAAVTAPDEITMRVWERGVGETLSCGTGACAAAAVAHRRGLVGERVTVRVPGGELAVQLGETIRLGGAVRHVFDVEVDVARLTAVPR